MRFFGGMFQIGIGLPPVEKLVETEIVQVDPFAAGAYSRNRMPASKAHI